MTASHRALGSAFLGIGVAIVLLCVLSSCGRKDVNRVQGYVEGEFVYVASPLAGQLESLYVQRGAQVQAGDRLFALATMPEEAMRDEARRQLAQAKANLEDLKKGRRPTEIASVEAQLSQARAALGLSEIDFTRNEKLAQSGARSAQDLDRARSTRDQDRQRVVQLEADLKTAQLGSRIDQIEAAEASVRGLEAALAKAEWNLSQKNQSAPQAGLVFDTLYRQGEWVAAGRPAVVLLPPQNIKVRAFVPEKQAAAVQVGDPVRVFVDGLPEPLIGRVNFISPKAEYTPPVIYSQESRSKLVFMIEVVFSPTTAVKLHPGQPLDVQFGS